MNNTLEYLLSIVKQKIDSYSKHTSIRNSEDDYELILVLVQRLSKEFNDLSQKYEEAILKIKNLERIPDISSANSFSSNVPQINPKLVPFTCQDKIIEIMKNRENKPISLDQLRGLVKEKYGTDYGSSSYHSAISRMKTEGIIKSVGRGFYILFVVSN